MKILLTGANGYIGKRLLPVLLSMGHEVVCCVRDRKRLPAAPFLQHPSVSILELDLLNVPPSVPNLDDVDAAYYLVHSMSDRLQDFEELEVTSANNFIRLLMGTRVQQIIYLGGIVNDPRLSRHLSSRKHVDEILRSSGIPVTTLKAGIIVGSGSSSFEIIRDLVERLPVMITPRWVNTLSQPISVVNVIRYLVDALHVIETKGRTFDIGGPEALCYRDIMRIMAEELGLKRRWIIPVPILSPQLSSYWIHLITPLTHDIAKPLAEGLKNPVVCREDRIRDLIPQDLITVRGAIRTALAQVARNEVETSWSMAGAIPGDPDWAGGASFIDRRQAMVEAPAVAAFRAVCRIGGSHGWYAANALWTIRGWLDRLVGGPGLRRGRRDSELVAYGDAIDFWRVVGFELNRRLALRAEMRLPGDALLEFRVTPAENGRCTIEQVARFRPKGLLGMLYWYAVSPLHYIVFDGMLRGIRREANRIATSMAATKSLHQT